MFNLKNFTFLLFIAWLPVSAQIEPPKVGGLFQVWYTQMMDSNLRYFDQYSTGYLTPFMGVAPQYKENTLAIKRIDLKVSGRISDNVEYYINIDPTINNTGPTSVLLQDVFIKYKMPHQLELMVGQFKPFQTLDGFTPPPNYLFVEYTQLANLFTPRDRGAWLSKGFGDPSALGGRIHVGMVNGNTKANDANAQKEIVARLDMNYGRQHTFGAYAMQGGSDQADNGSLNAKVFQGPDAPSQQEVLDNNDKTDHYGIFYVFQNEKFYASGEVMTGLWGRRAFPSVYSGATAPPLSANRVHLDQSFLSYVGVLAYTHNRHHKFLARYDMMDYNYGDKWYTSSNPYIQESGDYSPKITEVTFGYTYVFLPDRYSAANIKVNYTMRSKNFMYPRDGQSGPQGGDSLVIAFQVGF